MKENTRMKYLFSLVTTVLVILFFCACNEKEDTNRLETKISENVAKEDSATFKVEYVYCDFRNVYHTWKLCNTFKVPSATEDGESRKLNYGLRRYVKGISIFPKDAFYCHFCVSDNEFKELTEIKKVSSKKRIHDIYLFLTKEDYDLGEEWDYIQKLRTGDNKLLKNIYASLIEEGATFPSFGDFCSTVSFGTIDESAI